MTKIPQIRWKQRLKNFKNALADLEEAVALSGKRTLSKLEKQGEIKAFEFTFELSWNVMKDYLTMQGISGIIGSRGAFRTAFQNGLISNGEAWMDMIDDRNLVSLSYDEETANAVASRLAGYAKLFRIFADATDTW